jgi:hypothetical protein
LAQITANAVFSEFGLKKSPDDFSKEDLMKNRSFLFLIAALALGLALLGCSTDSDDGGTTTITVKEGYASQVDAIAAAFEKAPDVYLTGPVGVNGNEMLLVKSGNRLHLETFTITVADGGGIAIEEAGGIVWGDGSVTGDAADAAYLIGPSGAFTGKAVTKVGTLAITPADDAGVAYTSVNNRAVGATTDYTKVFGADGVAKAPGGTLTVLITPSFTVPATHYTNGGSLAVTGNVTLVGTLAGAGGFDVYGNLTSNVNDTEKPTLVSNDLTARKITTDGGDFGKTVTIKSPTEISVFGGTQTTVTGAFEATGPVDFTGAEFTAAATIGGNASFSRDVEFKAASTIGGKATFASNRKVVGKVTVSGQVSAGASGTNTLLLGPGGEIIYTGGVENSFLDNVGTLAALSQSTLGTIAVSLSADELAVSGAGSFVIGNQPITLSGNNQIKVDGTTGVYFTAAGGKIVSATYELGGVAGTLSDSNGADGGFILTKDSIINDVENGSASLTHTGDTNSATSIILKVLPSKNLIISDVNIALNTATGGSISLGGGSASIILTGAGSITTTASEIAWGGTIFTDYVASGSLVAGSKGYGEDSGSIAAGSIGTAAGNFITHNGSFAILSVKQVDILKAVGSAGSNPDEELSAAKGSIAVFQISE